jgi:large subunit ribosomal protein L24
MQKIIRINVQNRTQIVKKARSRLQATRKTKDKSYWDFNARHTSEQTQLVHAEKKRRREDWLLGPLAPDRDVGSARGTYGAVSTLGFARQERPRHIDVERNEGPGHWRNVMVGDRVCCVDGHYKGQVGQVMEVNYDKGTLSVKGVNMVRLFLVASVPD